ERGGLAQREHSSVPGLTDSEGTFCRLSDPEKTNRPKRIRTAPFVCPKRIKNASGTDASAAPSENEFRQVRVLREIADVLVHIGRVDRHRLPATIGGGE